MIQEGVTFSLGLFTPGGDAQWIVAMGVPDLYILIAGLCLLCAGVGMLAWLLPWVGIRCDYSFAHTFSIVTAGMCFFMLIRSVYAFSFAPTLIIENLIPMVFALLLATMVSLLYRPIANLVKKYKVKRCEIAWSGVILSIILGGIMFGFQLMYFN